MRRKPSFIIAVERRISNIRETAKLDTQFYRQKLVLRLNLIFNLATSIATGEVRQLKVCGKLENITAKERQIWAHVAAHVAEVIGNPSSRYDEKDFKEDLAELERQIDEIRQLQCQTDKSKDKLAEANPANDGTTQLGCS